MRAPGPPKAHSSHGPQYSPRPPTGANKPGVCMFGGPSAASFVQQAARETAAATLRPVLLQTSSKSVEIVKVMHVEYRDNGNEAGNYYSMGFYRENGAWKLLFRVEGLECTGCFYWAAYFLFFE